MMNKHHYEMVFHCVIWFTKLWLPHLPNFIQVLGKFTFCKNKFCGILIHFFTFNYRRPLLFAGITFPEYPSNTETANKEEPLYSHFLINFAVFMSKFLSKPWLSEGEYREYQVLVSNLQLRITKTTNTKTACTAKKESDNSDCLKLIMSFVI
jgi:hypothetical protein